MQSNWLVWIVVFLALIEAGWMVFDGTRALTVGDYVTPSEGEHAGQLGPWASVVSAVGIEPRSTGMKIAFVAFGSLWLIATVLFVLRVPGAVWGMLAAAVLSLWYLPVGTVLSFSQIGLLVYYLASSSA